MVVNKNTYRSGCVFIMYVSTLPFLFFSIAENSRSVFTNTFVHTSCTTAKVAGEHRAATVYVLQPATALTSLIVYARLSQVSLVHSYDNNASITIILIILIFTCTITSSKEVSTICAPLNEDRFFIIV